MLSSWLLPVSKEAPTVSDVHVNMPIGAIRPKPQGLKDKDDPGTLDVDFDDLVGSGDKDKKDDPGTQDVNVAPVTDLSLSLPDTNDSHRYVVKENIEKKISGNSDIPLSKEGQKLAQSLGQRLKVKGGLDVVYSSPLARGVQTAEAIAKADTNVKLGPPRPAIQPWHLGEIEGKEPKDVKLLIKHYILHPDEVPPGKGRDGKPAESFNTAKKRQLDFDTEIYQDSVDHPNWKIGVVMHSRGMELLQAWVKNGCPEDYKLDDETLFDPDDPDHADVLRWHNDKIKDIDLDEDDELKPGVYCILHSLTTDDHDEGNPELKKGGPGSGPHPSQGSKPSKTDKAKESADALLAQHDQVKEHPGRTSATPSSAAESNYRSRLHDLKSSIEEHGQKYGLNQAAKSHMAQATYHLYSGTKIGKEAALMSMHNAIRAIGHVSKVEEEGREVIQTEMKFLPPLEVHKAAHSAYEAGISVLEITSALANQEGLTAYGISKIYEHFNTTESATESESACNAWGGNRALKWASRVLQKHNVSKDDDAPDWVTMNGNHILLGGDGLPSEGHPFGSAAQSVEPPSKSELAKIAYIPCRAEVQAAADRQEEILSKALGIPRTGDNSPFDLQNDTVGIELKTFLYQKNNKVTMNKEALENKRGLAASMGSEFKTYTVVADTRVGRTQYYMKEGVGSFQLSSMTRTTTSELRAVVRGN